MSHDLTRSAARSASPFRTLLSASAFALSLGLFVSGCGSQAAATDHGRGGAFTSLGFDEATLADNGTPHYLAGRMNAPAPVRDADGAASLLIGQLGTSYRLAKETSLSLINQSTDDAGNKFMRLQQRHAGLQVIGRQVAVQLSSDGVIETILGTLEPSLQVDITPRLSGSDTIALALGSLAQGAPRVISTPELSIYIDSTGTPRLVYGARVEYMGKNGHTIEDLYAAATDGAVVAQLPRIYTGLKREIYTLGGACISDGSNLPGTLTIAEGGTSTDMPSTRAYNNTSNVYYYYKWMFNRDSYDNKGVTLTSTVNVTFDTGMGSCDGGNAAWIPDPFNEMTYGKGSPFILKELTLGFDVAAHEISHAVTYATSNLDYLDESGALNEANSDIMGATAEAWVGSGGGTAGNPAMWLSPLPAKTWEIGEDVAGVLIPGGALRFMNNPTADMISKDWYADRVLPGGDDNGGVHMNSGIANLAFYLLTSGGSHPRSKSPGIKVTGVGIVKAATIFYTANTTLYTSKTDFQAARYATARAAELLYGRCGAEWVNVHRAWDAVGVPGTWNLCISPPSGF